MDNRIISASGVPTSLQVSMFGAMPTGDFSIVDGNAYKPFLVHVPEDMELTVIPASAPTDATVTITFEAGWNPMVVRKVLNAPSGLFFGY